jgi:hypothetical protein
VKVSTHRLPVLRAGRQSGFPGRAQPRPSVTVRVMPIIDSPSARLIASPAGSVSSVSGRNRGAAVAVAAEGPAHEYVKNHVRARIALLSRHAVAVA